MLCAGNALASEASSASSKPCCPKTPSQDYDSRETSVISMMGWGVGIFAGIAILCSLMKNNPANETTSK
jgi:hypothetical protein